MQKVVHKVFLDDVAFIAETYNEFVKAILAIDLHDMPQHGPTANFDHGLWPGFRFFRNACTKTSREKNHFHKSSFKWRKAIEKGKTIFKRFKLRKVAISDFVPLKQLDYQMIEKYKTRLSPTNENLPGSEATK